MNVRTLCLGILMFEDSTGYEIKQRVEKGMFSHFIEASYGSIYPALSALCAEGLVTCKEQSQEGRPGKKIYAITDQGCNALKKALATTQVSDKFKSEYLFHSLLADLASEEDISNLYEKRLEYMRNELAEIENILRTCDHEGSRFVAGYGQAVVAAGLKYLEEHKPKVSRPPQRAAE